MNFVIRIWYYKHNYPRWWWWRYVKDDAPMCWCDHHKWFGFRIWRITISVAW